jgi:hypothetical protein
MDSLAQLLAEQKHTFGDKLPKLQKKQFYNRVHYLKRFWHQQEDRFPFTQLLRQRGFAELGDQILER